MLQGMMSLMSISEQASEGFFFWAPGLWGNPRAFSSCLVSEPIDRLAEDECPVAELEDAYAVEALIYGGA